MMLCIAKIALHLPFCPAAVQLRKLVAEAKSPACSVMDYFLLTWDKSSWRKVPIASHFIHFQAKQGIDTAWGCIEVFCLVSWASFITGLTLESYCLKADKNYIPSDIWKGRFSGKKNLLIYLHSPCFQFILFADCDFFCFTFTVEAH